MVLSTFLMILPPILLTTPTIPVTAHPLHPNTLIFLIPVHNQWEQEAIHRHSMNFDATAEQAILSIQTVIGSVKIPMDKRPPPVVKLNKSGSLRISLKTMQDWDRLKALWEAEYKKKQFTYDIIVIMTKKMLRKQ
ncbi:hypothetical protein K439DRAFT_1612405 [Ramaria rubella]|nr:hypothetical protein K439DRAFT_1612405 [Ramaria rubella]